MQVVPLPQNDHQQPTYVGVPVNPQSSQYQSIPTNTERQIETQQQQIPTQYLIQQQSVIQNIQVIQPVIDLTAMAMQNIKIPDEVIFEHVFERRAPWFGSTWSEKSIFKIAGLGTLWMGDEYRRHFGFFWRFIPRKTNRTRKFSDFRGLFNHHYFKVPDYIIENELIEMDFWNCIGTIIVGGIPLLQFQSTEPNFYDVAYGHCCVGFPKVVMYYLLEPTKQPLIIIPDISQCPETTLGVNGEFAICGVCTTQRYFTVEGLTQGSCTIFNTRTCSDACAKAYFLQGDCCFPHVDYPHFKVNFVNVLPVERLAILLGLVHYNIIKKWYVIVQITRKTVGAA